MHYLVKRRSCILLAGTMFLFQACSYSVIVYNRDGISEPSPVNDTIGFYNGKTFHVIDTLIKLSVAQNDIMMNTPLCPAGGFYSLEYKITFGDMLRNTFTLGKKKAVKVKYVCLKNSN